MQNIVVNMCVKFHYDRLRNDRALANRKSDNNNNNIRSQWGPVSRSKNRGSNNRQSWMETSGLWLMFRWEQQGENRTRATQ